MRKNLKLSIKSNLVSCKNLNPNSSKTKLKRVSWSGFPVQVPGVRLRDYETETAFQIYCATWLRKQHCLTADERFSHWHHSANERLGARAGFKAKMMGQAKGWPDFVQPGLRCALELKLLNGVVSAEQADWLAYFHSIGWHSETVFSFEQFREIVLGL